MYKQPPRQQPCRNIRLVLSWVLLLTSTKTSFVNVICQRGDSTATTKSGISSATASAFSLASIFPRKTETQRRLPIEDNTQDKQKDDDKNNNNLEHLHEMQGNFFVSTSTSVNGGTTRMSPDEPSDGFMRFGVPQDMEQQYNSNSNNNNRISEARQQSVHLQLKDMVASTAAAITKERVESLLSTQQQKQNRKESEEPHTNGDDPMHADDDQQQQQHPHNGMTRVRVHTYIDPKSNRKWVALNTSRRKFLAFLQYNGVSFPSEDVTDGKSAISTEIASLQDPNSKVVEDKANQQYIHDSRANTVECATKKNWRDLWNARQLLTDRTELLAVYQSDHNEDDDAKETNIMSSETQQQEQQQSKKPPKRGGFSDLLNLYTNRLVAILNDEEHDERTPPDERHRSSLLRPLSRNRWGFPLADPNAAFGTDHRILIKWLEDNYGMSETLMLQASRFRTLPVPAQLELMNHFMHWFRGYFPYYYDRCDSCGVSQKDELAAQAQQQAENGSANHDEDDHAAAITAQEEKHCGSHDEDDDDDNATFLGYVYPSQVELKGKASRTELYQCHKCGSFTRFPRFNSAFDIIQSRRGRCGEYSLLLYRFLRALNHDARWVVDWADHVWAEVLIGDNHNNNKNGPVSEIDNSSLMNSAKAQSQPNGGSSSSERWVHLDPCEAAVDNNYLYESWGKKQTYIIALYAPLRYQAMRLQNRNLSFPAERTISAGAVSADTSSPTTTVSSLWTEDAIKAHLVEDVTQDYTTDSWETICKRREESSEEVEAAIQTAIKDLHEMLEI